MLDSTLPKGSTLLMILSFTFIAAGVLSGIYLVRRRPSLGSAGTTAAASDWLGLPQLIEIVFVRPTDALAGWAARIDDAVIDAGSRGTARVGDALARISDRFGEAFTDGLPEGSASLTGMLGRDLRRLQTGLSHHYYAYIIGGVIAVIAILAAGA